MPGARLPARRPDLGRPARDERRHLRASLVILLATGLCLLASQGYLRREGILSGEYHALLLWCASGLLLMLRGDRAADDLPVARAALALPLLARRLPPPDRDRDRGGDQVLPDGRLRQRVRALRHRAGLRRHRQHPPRGDRRGARAACRSVPVTASLGLLLLVAGFGFKMSVVPFHAWSPDTYQGAPSPFVAFLSVAPKVASALVLFRLLEAVVAGGMPETIESSGRAWWRVARGRSRCWSATCSPWCSATSSACSPTPASRTWATCCSRWWCSTATRSAPVIVYLLAYVLMNAGAFAVVTMLYSRPGEQHLISDLSGWGYRYPLLGACLAICMLSLGGIPPTVGFFGKYLVFLNAVGDGLVGLAVLGVLASLVGVFYYLRVVYVLYMKAEERQPEGLLIDVWGRAAAVLAALGTLALGIWPSGICCSGFSKRPRRQVNEIGGGGLSSHPQPALVLPPLPAPSAGAGGQAHLLAGAGAALPPLRDPDPQGPGAVRRVRHPRRRLRGRRARRPPERAPRPRPRARHGDRRHGQPGQRARPVPRLQLRRLPGGGRRGQRPGEGRPEDRRASWSAAPTSCRRWCASPAPRSACSPCPPRRRRRTTTRLADAGIKAVLNFAPVRVKRRPGVPLKNVDLRIHLEELAFFLR